MRIAVCDDEPNENAALEEIISSYMLKNDIDCEVVSFTSGLMLLREEKFDLYFLDYRMPELDGVELAARLNESFSRPVNVCFITSYEAAAVTVINRDIQTVGFLKKPVDASDVESIFDKLKKRAFFNRILLKKGNDMCVLNVYDILYAEARLGGINLVSADGAQDFRYSFHEIEENFLSSAVFFKVHRSFIVNLSMVSSFSKKEITMKNGDKIPISRHIDFDKAMKNFVFNQNLRPLSEYPG